MKSLVDALTDIDQKATSMGKQGWTMVSHNVTVSRTDGGMYDQVATLWVVTCYMARPLRPGS
jgi:hypothetical protein